MKSSLSFAKVWFALSLLVLAFGYGFASHAWGLFPKNLIEQAWSQAYGQFSEKSLSAATVEQVYDRAGVHIAEPENVQEGMILVTSSWKWDDSDELAPGAKLIDRDGQTVHSWKPNRSELFSENDLKDGDPETSEYHGAYLLPNGDVLLVLLYIGVVRLNSCGEVVWQLDKRNHHSVARAENGTFWIPGTSSERRTSTSAFPDGFPGIDKPVWLDQILHVSEGAEVLDKINVLDVLYQNGLERHIVKSMKPYPTDVKGAPSDMKDDPVHLNDIEPLDSSMAGEYPLFEAGDLLISLRHPSLVLVFDPGSKEVKWHASEPWIHQHDPDFIGDGWIGVFDNNTDLAGRGEMLGGSRIVAVQPHTDSTGVLFPTQHSDPFYTATRGNWQKLENGNMLLTEARAGRVVEVAPEGQTVWEWIKKPYEGSEVPLVTGSRLYSLTREEVASWSCSSVDSISTSAQKQSTAP